VIGKTIALRQADTVRLISSARLKPPALKPLVDNDDELALLAELESATNGRLTTEDAGTPAISSREFVFGVPSYSFINAAFAYTRPGGNRFNRERRGAWYCGFEVETSLAEVAYHLTRALADADDAFDNTTEFAELYADFNGAFCDLRKVKPRPRCLDPDVAVGYPAGQALADEIRAAERALGVVYPSVRRAGGTCLAAFHPYVVQNVRQGGLWRLTWKGKAEPEVRRVAG
jgi:hypothetical protein